MILILNRLSRRSECRYPPRARYVLAALLVVLLLGACDTSDDAVGTDRLLVVTTTTVLGDVAHNIVGSNGTVEVLLPVGIDPHDYAASSQQVAMLHDADLVVVNGLSLEESLTDVIEAAAADGANVLQVAPLLDPIPIAGEVSDRGNLDPHVWMDPVRVAEAARLIARQLSVVQGSVDWPERADAYAGKLLDADREIENILAGVQMANRKLVTNHDALGYFAQRYGFQVIGVVIPGGSTLANPSSAELAKLVGTIEREMVPAIFAETTEPAALAQAVAAAADDDIDVIELYTGSLGETNSGADSVIGMLLTNARLIADALN